MTPCGFVVRSAISCKAVVITLVSVTLLSLLLYQEAWPSSFDPDSFLRMVNKVLEDPLPTLSTVVPGYTRSAKHVPGLIVAEFSSNQESAMPWGSAIGRILRRKLMAVPKIIMQVPDPNGVHLDASSPGMPEQDVLRSMESLKLIGRRLAIDNALTGSVSIDGERYDMTVRLVKLSSEQTQATFHYSGSIDDMPETFSKIGVQVYEALGVKLDKTSGDYLSKRTPESSYELKQFVLLLSLLRDATGDQMSYLPKRFIDGGAYLPAAATLYIRYLESGKDLNAYLKRLDEVGQRYPSDAGIQLAIASAVGYKATGTLRKEMIERLRALVKENPNDPTSIINLAELLNEDYQHFEAITLCEEAIKRWPNHYRVWWATSWVINHYAGYLRGMKSWSEVSPKGKRLWGPLRDLAYRAVNRAIELHPYVPQLWVQKMYAISEYSQEMMDCFYKAIEYAPHYDRAYIAALIFTMPQWGGTVEAQQKVYDIALKNNPYAPWLEKVRRELMKLPPEKR